MRRLLTHTALALGLSWGTALPAWAQTPPELTLTRLECGTPGAPASVARFSDTFGHRGLVLQLVYSCYLIRHGDEVMLWDTGHGPGAGAVAPKVTLVEQLAQLQIKPEQVRYVGISHYHPDHMGQAPSFAQSTLLIGKGDWDVVSSPKPPVNTAPLQHWLSGAGKVEQVPLDKDVFGDGRVVMLATPGHTPGHHSLLVRLKDMGAVLISGDMAHFRENFADGGVPSFNTDRSQTLASIDRIKKIMANLQATTILQHDLRDVDKLPTFPTAAR